MSFLKLFHSKCFFCFVLFMNHTHDRLLDFIQLFLFLWQCYVFVIGGFILFSFAQCYLLQFGMAVSFMNIFLLFKLRKRTEKVENHDNRLRIVRIVWIACCELYIVCLFCFMMRFRGKTCQQPTKLKIHFFFHSKNPLSVQNQNSTFQRVVDMHQQPL